MRTYPFLLHLTDVPPLLVITCLLWQPLVPKPPLNLRYPRLDIA